MQESGEMYLETILILKNRKSAVRSVDVAHALSFSKPSVSRAIGILKDDGYVTVGEGGELCLTEAGHARAAGIYERHICITKFLTEVLGVAQETAETDACRIEHIISGETFDKVKEYIARRDFKVLQEK